jgi:nucleoside-diphosphate-sugar epimerase
MISKSRVLITGGAGFVGSYLQKSFHHCLSLDVKASQGLTCSLLSPDSYESEVHDFDPEYVFHLASLKLRGDDFDSLQKSFEEEFKGTWELLKVLKRGESLKKVVMVGSTDEYGPGHQGPTEEIREAPVSAYGLIKTLVTHLSQGMGKMGHLPICVARPSLIYGPHQGPEMFLGELVSCLHKDQEFSMSPGEQVRDFLHVSDLVNALLTVAEKGIPGEVYNVARGEGVKLKDVALLAGELTKKSHLIHIGGKGYRDNEVMSYTPDVSKLKSLGWQPEINLKSGLSELLK